MEFYLKICNLIIYLSFIYYIIYLIIYLIYIISLYIYPSFSNVFFITYSSIKVSHTGLERQMCG